MITNVPIYQHAKDAGVFAFTLTHPDYRVVIKNENSDAEHPQTLLPKNLPQTFESAFRICH